ncbi:FixH protein [Chitinophaga jiangningensis]|uniref:FixH protein n=1 Tax=Chitinophaga jiangningensis TaxID=1419482 RepID=A0A1M7EF44_9BACT|nr:FixH family protein [Chitinophaga jiangningensis]SHL90402.1 FixH protein [Chitinophaga jiangningensis]
MNWGHSIIIVFVLFAAGILTLVTKSMRTKIDMVTKDYYSEELKYQEVIEGRTNAGSLSSLVKITQPAAAVAIQVPQELVGTPLTGTVNFYRPSDSGKDFSVPLNPDGTGTQIVGREKFIRGNYRVKVSWEMNNKPYYQEQVIHIN